MGPEHVLGTSEAFLLHYKPTKYIGYRKGAGDIEEYCSNLQVCKKYSLYLENWYLLSSLEIP